MPYLPAIALITALGLGHIRSARMARAVWAAVVVYALVQFIGLSFGLCHRVRTGLPPEPVLLRLGSAHLTLYHEDAHGASPPRAEDWHVLEILQHALQDAAASQGRSGGIRLLVVPNRPHFETRSFIFHAGAADLQVQVFPVTGKKAKDAARELEASDYVVIKTGYLGPAWSLQDAFALTQALQDRESDVGRQFTQVGEYRLPDSSTALLYRHDRASR
jgi:hypothetical protein